MLGQPVVLYATLLPDGTLELDRKLDLPAGRVQVIVQPLPQFPADDPFWQRMQAIWAARQAAGLTPRSVEEIETERRAIRDGAEREIEEAGRLQEASRRLRLEAEKAGERS